MTRGDPVEKTVPWERVERFVGQVAHDLRNGLNACELQLTFLAEISTDPEAVDEVKRLRGTVADMTKQLAALRVATGAVSVHPMEYPAADLFEDLRERFHKQQPESAARVEWNCQVDGEVKVSVDPELMLSAATELLRNALHFAPKGSRVVCSASEEGGGVRYDFAQDLGSPPVSAPEDWGKSPLVSSRRGAYGLGLFRVRRAVAAQGGELHFEPSVDGTKLTASLVLPGGAPTSS